MTECSNRSRGGLSPSRGPGRGLPAHTQLYSRPSAALGSMGIRQLVADASHELRTPVTTLVTNIEVLLTSKFLIDDERQLLVDVVEQADELTELMGDLIEPREAIFGSTRSRVFGLTPSSRRQIERAQRKFPTANIQANLEPVSVEGTPERLSRAVNNLLDNAGRRSPDAGLIEVEVNQTGLRVRDHGTAIDTQDQPHVFDGFYRGPSALELTGAASWQLGSQSADCSFQQQSAASLTVVAGLSRERVSQSIGLTSSR